MLETLRKLGHAVLVGVGASVGFVLTYALPFRVNRGPEGRWWERVRRVSSRLLGAVVDGRAGPRPITDGEYAGSVRGSLQDVERVLYSEGFVRNHFSRLKTRDGSPEVGSWAYREGPFARRQLHVMLFPGTSSDEWVDVYAHEELSSVNPVVGVAHFDGTDQRVAAGVERARNLLPLEERAATVDPPEGAWNSGLEREA